MRYRSSILAAMVLAMASLAIGQEVKTLQGVIGGEFEQFDISMAGDRNIQSYLRELATLSIQGNVYNHNLADYTLSTRILNTNSSNRWGGGKTKEQTLIINYYDLSVLLLKRTRFPLSFYLRRDDQSNRSSGDIPWAFSNRFQTSSGGGRFSYSFNNGSLPTVAFGFDRHHSESMTLEFPLDYLTNDFNAGIYQKIGKTTLNLNGLLNDRKDGVGGGRQTQKEVRFNQHTSLAGSDQLLSNGLWEQIQGLHRVNWNTLWNSRFSAATINQTEFIYQLVESPDYSNYDVGLRDQADFELSPEWRARAGGSMLVGRIENRGISRPMSNATVGGGLTYQVELGRIRPVVNAQLDFHRRTGDFQYRQAGGVVSVGFSTVNLRFVDLTISDQVGFIDTKNGLAYQTVSNMVSASASTTVISDFTLNGYTTYTTTKDIGRPFALESEDLRATFNASYQWSYLLRMYLTGGYTLTRIENNFFRQSLHQYSYELLVPELARNLQFTFKGTRSRDAFLWRINTTYDASLAYRFRLVTVTGRWVRYSFDLYGRDYYSITVSRPFGVVF